MARQQLGVAPANTLDAATKAYADTKEPAIAAGTTAQYWRGDKTWQTLTAGAPTVVSSSTTGTLGTVPVTYTGSAVTGGSGASQVTSYTTGSITCTAGNTLIVFVKTNNQSNLVTPTVTYSNGGTASLLGTNSSNGGNPAFGAMFAYQIPVTSTGSGTINVVSASAYINVDAAAYSGVGSVTNYTTANNSSTSLSVSATNVSNGMVVADLYSSPSVNGTITAGTQRIVGLADSNSASQVFSWNCTFGGNSAIAFSLNPTTATLVGSNFIYLLKSGAAPVMPTAVGNTALYTLKNTTASPMTLSTASQTIDGSTSIVLAPYVSVTLISDNANWWVL